MMRLHDAQDAMRRMEHPIEDEASLRAAAPLVRPYGDTTGDGMVQVSFTLPLPHDKRAEGAALQLAARWAWSPRSSSTRRPWDRTSRSSSSTAP